ncbi:MAG: phenylalanine--tRNA ligase subunit alpha [Bacteroides sp.]|nr:phenylalanine--tRNA ligase subunit alpha [Bacteroides sp.]MCM1085233.1 phenylalanine--tRNA ligase subunit alpha [Bacteroides sp.]MCM1168719.1 phenylalanine--tRNA ligase subunit alpha [Bacteroides sp.]MCM1530880.1 phenylalanine--tRNA ligase subunit alpha [Ruminococcus flavefaciens]MCM1553970.1 phenylalanine--tRNA ligase subunit alpha [Bacteroides sp.]
MSLKERIDNLLEEARKIKLASAEESEKYRIRILGKKGEMNELFEEFKKIQPELKKNIGQALNELKTAVQEKIQQAKNDFGSAGRSSENQEDFDMSRPVDDLVGHRHPLSLIREEIYRIFGKIGFDVSDGPEIEDDWHLFTALNFPPEHPARDMQDTFFVEKNGTNDVALRTHTSSVQIRTMQSKPLPIRTLCPGRVYRNEAVSARAHCFFHQVEGLYVDKGVSYADLREVLLYFAKEMFGSKTEIRLRPSYFPFTEPSAEMDIACSICGGKGCQLCKGTGWVEILGCGMVDPNVLENCGIDPDTYSGFAFGMGVERIANLLYRVNDLRLFSENDRRFLAQF